MTAMGRRTKSLISCALLIAGAGLGSAMGQSVGPVNVAPVLPVPAYPEVGAGVYVPPTSSSTGPGLRGSAGAGSGSSLGGGSGSSALSELESQSYGSAAINAASQAGISADAMADTALVESGFQNVGDGNGTTTATGPWQVTTSTFNYMNQKYDLGYSASDISNPSDEAVVAAYTMNDYAQQVEAETRSPPTIVQTYGAYVFGPGYGGEIASAPASEPLATIVPASELVNNGMSNWTVGQFYSTEAAKMGSSAYSSVFS